MKSKSVPVLILFIILYSLFFIHYSPFFVPQVNAEEGKTVTIAEEGKTVTILGGLVECDPVLPPSEKKSCNLQAIVTALQSVVKFLMPFVISLAVIFIIVGGFVIMTAGGNPGKRETGKKIILAAVIGLILFFGASLIVRTIYSLFGAKLP